MKTALKILIDKKKKMCETTTMSVDIMNSKQQLKGKLARGTNSRFPFAVNVMLNLSCIVG